MALTLTLTAPQSVPIEVEGITPAALAGLSAAESARLPVLVGNRRQELGELFEIQGDPADGRLDWHGDLAGVHWIGAGMDRGEVRVHGPAGRHTGSGMRGGAIHVAGNAGDWLGGEMHGGVITVRGDAGDLVGAAYRGSPLGMTGGTIVVHGAAGDEVGSAMRRGVIVIGGRLGSLAAFNMRAGTIAALGPVGARQGSGMRRGTLALLGERPAEMLPTFRYSCRYRPEIAELLVKLFRRFQLPLRAGVAAGPLELYQGDVLEGGRGELLLRAAG